jgi:hypothetical protein
MVLFFLKIPFTDEQKMLIFMALSYYSDPDIQHYGWLFLLIFFIFVFKAFGVLFTLIKTAHSNKNMVNLSPSIIHSLTNFFRHLNRLYYSLKNIPPPFYENFQTVQLQKKPFHDTKNYHLCKLFHISDIDKRIYEALTYLAPALENTLPSYGYPPYLIRTAYSNDTDPLRNTVRSVWSMSLETAPDTTVADLYESGKHRDDSSKTESVVKASTSFPLYSFSLMPACLYGASLRPHLLFAEEIHQHIIPLSSLRNYMRELYRCVISVSGRNHPSALREEYMGIDISDVAMFIAMAIQCCQGICYHAVKSSIDPFVAVTPSSKRPTLSAAAIYKLDIVRRNVITVVGCFRRCFPSLRWKSLVRAMDILYGGVGGNFRFNLSFQPQPHVDENLERFSNAIGDKGALVFTTPFDLELLFIGYQIGMDSPAPSPPPVSSSSSSSSSSLSLPSGFSSLDGLLGGEMTSNPAGLFYPPRKYVPFPLHHIFTVHFPSAQPKPPSTHDLPPSLWRNRHTQLSLIEQIIFFLSTPASVLASSPAQALFHRNLLFDCYHTLSSPPEHSVIPSTSSSSLSPPPPPPFPPPPLPPPSLFQTVLDVSLLSPLHDFLSVMLKASSFSEGEREKGEIENGLSGGANMRRVWGVLDVSYTLLALIDSNDIHSTTYSPTSDSTNGLYNIVYNLFKRACDGCPELVLCVFSCIGHAGEHSDGDENRVTRVMGGMGHKMQIEILKLVIQKILGRIITGNGKLNSILSSLLYIPILSLSMYAGISGGPSSSSTPSSSSSSSSSSSPSSSLVAHGSTYFDMLHVNEQLCPSLLVSAYHLLILHPQLQLQNSRVPLDNAILYLLCEYILGIGRVDYSSTKTLPSPDPSQTVASPTPLFLLLLKTPFALFTGPSSSSALSLYSGVNTAFTLPSFSTAIRLGAAVASLPHWLYKNLGANTPSIPTAPVFDFRRFLINGVSMCGESFLCAILCLLQVFFFFFF